MTSTPTRRTRTTRTTSPVVQFLSLVMLAILVPCYKKVMLAILVLFPESGVVIHDTMNFPNVYPNTSWRPRTRRLYKFGNTAYERNVGNVPSLLRYTPERDCWAR